MRPRRAPRNVKSGRSALPRRRSRRGVMLILTLWLCVVMGILASSITSHLMMQTRLMSMRRHRLDADALARAGVAKAIADLKNDMILDNTEKPQVFDGEGDIWKRPEEGKKNVKLGDGTYDVQVVDEDSKININTASPKLLAALLQQIGYDEDDAKLAAAAIVDWRDSDDKASVPGMTDRSESQVYGLLYAGGDPTRDLDRAGDFAPARIKNDNFLTIDELLSVYGITPEVYFGPGSPEAEQMMNEYPDRWTFARKGVGSGRRFQIKKSHSRFRDTLPLGLKDCVTVYGTGNINVNTASLEVLSALLRAAGINSEDPESMAEKIIRYRRSDRTDDIDDNQAFRTVNDVSAAGIGSAVGQLQAANQPAGIGVVSSTFTITSTGRTQQYSRTLKVIVRRDWEVFSVNKTNEDEQRAWEKRHRQHEYDPWRTSDSDRRSGKVGPNELTVLWPSVRVLQWVQP